MRYLPAKPAPDVYLKVAEDLQVDPSCCLVFEDVPNGILAGKNAGMEVCAVDDEFSRSFEQKRNGSLIILSMILMIFSDILMRGATKCRDTQ